MKQFSIVPLLVIFPAFLIFGALDIKAQVLSGVDDLGRVLPQQDEVGLKKDNRQVGLFYFLWQGDINSPIAENNWDLHELYRYNTEIFYDYNHPIWGDKGGYGKFYYWGEPIYGYYRGDDYWVHLKNIQLLTEAEVDFLVIDATNRLIYPQQTKALLRAMQTVRDQGKNAPKIVFYTNTQSGETIQDIYDTYYAPDAPIRYPDNWYYLDGKPLIIGISSESKGRNYEHFFSYRESQWPNEPDKLNGWPWIDFHRPQGVYKNESGKREIINVSVAQHPNLAASMGGSAFYDMEGNWGRSFHHGEEGTEKDIHYGFNAQEQWDYALQQNTPFIFITGWNEWVAGKWKRSDSLKEYAHFVDQASPEYSRDIEPTYTAGLKDNYFMQMVANIRRYKGLDSISSIHRKEMSSDWPTWESVPVFYEDYVGDVAEREHSGAPTKPEIIYRNTTGRNDLHQVKLVADKESIYFYVNTIDDLTPNTDYNWMTLWLNVDESYKSGWNGFDFRVIGGNTLQRYSRKHWQTVAQVESRWSGKELMIKIPYAQLAIPNKDFKLEFKWSDNMQKLDPLDWYVNGDVAPEGRFNFIVQF